MVAAANHLAHAPRDARNFRIKRGEYSNNVLIKTTHDYYTSRWQCIEQRDDDPSNADPPVLNRQFVWGKRYIDDLVQRKRDTTGNGTLDEELYALTDRQFNVVALADDTGAIVQRMTYQPYGQATFLTNAYASAHNTKDWYVLFQGLRADLDGFIYNRNRLLDPLSGRFLQRDPLGYPDGLNAYAGYHLLYGLRDASGSAINNYGSFSNDRRTVLRNILKGGHSTGQCKSPDCEVVTIIIKWRNQARSATPR